MLKVNPIVEWTQQQVDDYIAANNILVNPLVYDGYPSIGCRTCTRQGRRRGRPAQRPVDRHRQDRMRYPHRLTPPPVVAVAHGSRDPRAGAAVTALLRLARDRAAARGLAGLEARAAFLGHAAPAPAQVLDALAS